MLWFMCAPHLMRRSDVFCLCHIVTIFYCSEQAVQNLCIHQTPLVVYDKLVVICTHLITERVQQLAAVFDVSTNSTTSSSSSSTHTLTQVCFTLL